MSEETQFQTVQVKKTEWKKLLTFSGFDPHQGTLNSIVIQQMVTLNANAQASVTISSKLPTGQVVTAPATVDNGQIVTQTVVTLSDVASLAAFRTQSFLYIPVSTATIAHHGVSVQAGFQLIIKYEYT